MVERPIQKPACSWGSWGSMMGLIRPWIILSSSLNGMHNGEMGLQLLGSSSDLLGFGRAMTVALHQILGIIHLSKQVDIWRVYFQKGLIPLFIHVVLRKSPFFRITILHFIKSDNFVANERRHMKKPKTHNSFTLWFLYRFLCISLFSTICGFKPFWK